MKDGKSMRAAFVGLGFVVLAGWLGGCTGPVIAGSSAAMIVATKPSPPPPADAAQRIQTKETWCYSTSGAPQCYPSIQDVPPGRLINVDPQNRYPVDMQTYRDALNDKNAGVSAGGPVPLMAVPVKNP